MATSKCPSCSGTRFENKLHSPTGYKFRVNFIQCSSCGAVVGVLPYYDPGYYGQANAEAITKLQQKVDSLQSDLSQVLQRLRSGSRVIG